MINTLTLNPALDKIIFVDKFEKNSTVRIKEITYSIGGKGTHVSINLAQMGERSRAFGIVFGDIGKQILSLLRESNIDTHFVQRQITGLESRTNYLLNEKNGDSTLITEKGVMLRLEDVDEVCQTMKENIQKGDYIALSGDASNYSDPYVYNYIINKLKTYDLKVFLDTSGDTLKECIKLGPELIKPNLSELSFLCGRRLENHVDDVIDAIQELNEYEIPNIAVSMGGEGCVIKHGDEYYRAIPPKIEIKNTVGCGDCFLSGLLYGFKNNLEIKNTILYATAVSAACALDETSVGFDMNAAKSIMKDVKILKI